MHRDIIVIFQDFEAHNFSTFPIAYKIDTFHKNGYISSCLVLEYMYLGVGAPSFYHSYKHFRPQQIFSSKFGLCITLQNNTKSYVQASAYIIFGLNFESRY